jgi:hypothetical protein
MIHATACSSVEAPETDAGEPPRPPSEAPVNTTSAGTIAENGVLSLATLLVSADGDTAADQLVYTVRSLPAGGTLQLDSTTLAVGSTFTQADVADGRVTYHQNGAEGATDSFTWTLSDGSNTLPATGTAPFSITVLPVNDLPVIVSNPLTTLAEGATDVLSMTRLLVTDAEDTAPLVFTFVSAAHGALEKRVGAGPFMALAPNATFTGADIAAGNVRFVDSGVDDAPLVAGQNTTASFSWRVKDSEGGFNPSPTTANVSTYTVTPIDDAPVISWRAQRCHHINVADPADPVISISDVDTAISQYSICVVSIGNATSIFHTTTTTIGTTTTFPPTLKDGVATLAVNSCIPATARSGLTLTSSANSHGGSVTWKLVRNAVTFGPNATVEFPMSTPPC